MRMMVFGKDFGLWASFYQSIVVQKSIFYRHFSYEGFWYSLLLFLIYPTLSPTQVQG